jgi:hypothetical protein
VHHLRPIVASASVIALMAGAFVLMSAGSAYAASCTGRGCATQDPNASGCTAASSITKTYQSGSAVATFVNEYSKVCNANWVLAYENAAAQNAGWGLYIKVSTTDSIGGQEYMCMPQTGPVIFEGKNISESCGGWYSGATGWPTWTDMVDGTNKSYGKMWIYSRSGAQIGTVENDQ